jgi:hypothetical protein
MLAPEITHLAPDLKKWGLDFTFYLKVASNNKNGSCHLTLSWTPGKGVEILVLLPGFQKGRDIKAS